MTKLPKKITDRFDHLRTLKDGWHEVDSLAPVQKAFEQIEKVVKTLIKLGVNFKEGEYGIFPTIEGGLVLEFHEPSISFEYDPEEDYLDIYVGDNDD